MQSAAWRSLEWRSLGDDPRKARKQQPGCRCFPHGRGQVATGGLGTDVAIPCVIAAVTLEQWNVEPDRPAKGSTAMQQQLGERQTNDIIRPNAATMHNLKQTQQCQRPVLPWTPPWMQKNKEEDMQEKEMTSISLLAYIFWWGSATLSMR